MSVDIIFQIAILIMSVVVHEVAHGYAAYLLGDPTAKYQGRLSINPLKHLDPFGSVVLPLLLAITKAGFIIGWAKPVPFNPYNFRAQYQRWGEAIVAVAGPASNLLIALVFGIGIRFAIATDMAVSLPVLQITSAVVFINILLAIFNLVPIPPLDGSKILFSFFPRQALSVRPFLERWGFAIVLFFILFLWQFLVPVIDVVFGVVTGISF